MNFNFKQSLVGIFCLLTVVACDIKSTDDNSGGASAPASSKFSADIVDGTSLNEFSVKLHLPAGQNFILRRLYRSNPELEIAVANDYLDQKVLAGKTYVYAIGALENKSFVESQEITVTVPMDVFVNDQVIIKQEDLLAWSNVRNLTFLPGSILLTEGLSLTIHARHLQSQGGSIESFSVGQTAAQGSVGRSGGELQLMVDSGEGLLNIVMRGENGGLGSPGALGARFQPGSAGGPGFAGGDSGTVHLRGSADFKAQIYHIAGIGGAGGAGGAGGFSGDCHINSHEQVSANFKLGQGLIPAEDICPVPKPAGPSGAMGSNGKVGQTCILETDDSSETCKTGQVLAP